jgi:hypothetical protein
MIVELGIDSRVLSHALDVAPSVTVTMEQMDASKSIPLRNLFWASGIGLDRFDDALDEDPTVRDWSLVASTQEGNLYRIIYAADLPDVAAYAALQEQDGVVLGVTNREDRYVMRARFPDREAVQAFRETCEQAGLPTTVRAVYDRLPEAPGAEHGLTPSQEAVLLTALERGYFEVPRKVTLSAVADELDISTQAASERLRRGLTTLLRRTLSEG